MNKKVFSIFFILTLCLVPAVALAIDPLTWFQGIIDRLLEYVILPVFSGLVVIMFLYAGFLFLTAQGDAAKISTARKVVIWGLVGVAVALLSYSVVKFVEKIVAPGEDKTLEQGGVGGEGGL